MHCSQWGCSHLFFNLSTNSSRNHKNGFKPLSVLRPICSCEIAGYDGLPVEFLTPAVRSCNKLAAGDFVYGIYLLPLTSCIDSCSFCLVTLVSVLCFAPGVYNIFGKNMCLFSILLFMRHDMIVANVLLVQVR